MAARRLAGYRCRRRTRTGSIAVAVCVALQAVVAGQIRSTPSRQDGRLVAVGISDPAYAFISQQAGLDRLAFTVYEDADSGLNGGFPSGRFGALDRVQVDPACIPDVAAASGCSSDPTVISPAPRGTVFAVTFAPLASGQFAGVNFEEPEGWGSQPRGFGYDLTGSTRILFDVLVPTPGGLRVEFTVGGRSAGFVHIPQGTSFETRSLDLQDMGLTPGELSDLHLLFGVATNDLNAPAGGTILLDRIRFDPAPVRQATQVALPLANLTHGVRPVDSALAGRVRIPPDQLLRNLATTYESALVTRALLHRGTPADVAGALRVADALVHAVMHPNPGIALPEADDGSRGLHSGYSGGNLALHNDQSSGPARRGDVRFAGFSGSAALCGASRFCVVLDGATGGNNAFAIAALLEAYSHTHDQRYLDAARTIARWIHGRLLDPATDGFGGYFLGYPDEGIVPKVLIRAKSIENNADIHAAFSALAAVERTLGSGFADLWDARARVAGDFVMAMFDVAAGRFNAGTVPVGTAANPANGIAPDGPRRGDDVVNTFDFLDANTFSILALAESPAYRSAIDWRRPLRWVLDHQAVTVTAGGRAYSGFSLVSAPVAGPPGIAWEFTGQVVVAMQIVDRLYGESSFTNGAAASLNQLRQAQRFAPFAQDGLPAATLEDGDTLPPYEQCLSTPFQCIAQRPGLAATAWAIFAEAGLNPLAPSDGDGDGLLDSWERRFGVDPGSPLGADGADGDPDGDGRTNAQEFTAGTHPRGFHQRYLAEGAINAFFDTRLALLNVGPATAHVQVRLLQPGGIVAAIVESLAPLRRRTVAGAELALLLTSSDVSTLVESDQPIVVDRTMSWDRTGYGSHAEGAVPSPATTWYLAEGSTSGDFALFYLLQNPNPTATTVTVRYLLPFAQPPIERQYALAANARRTIAVDGEGPVLAATDVSAVITAPIPIVAERAMYFTRSGRTFSAGHGSTGVTAPADRWFLAEGATGPFFDLFILLANPNPQPATVTIEYLLLTGDTLRKTYAVPANGRFTVWADEEQIPAGSGQKPLDNVAVSSAITSDVPIVVERTMWWPSPVLGPDYWTEAHNSAGATATGTRWALAEGEVGGVHEAETYLLIANTSATAGQARVTLYFEDGTSAVRTVTLPAHSRTNVAVSARFPEAAGRRFGALVESLGPEPAEIVVERAMYTSPGGATWAAGTDALATRLP